MTKTIIFLIAITNGTVLHVWEPLDPKNPPTMEQCVATSKVFRQRTQTLLDGDPYKTATFVCKGLKSAPIVGKPLP